MDVNGTFLEREIVEENSVVKKENVVIKEKNYAR